MSYAPFFKVASVCLILSLAANSNRLPAQEPISKQESSLPLVFEDSFETGSHRWETTHDDAWTLTDETTANGSTNHFFAINRRVSDYRPPHRSPHNIALIRGVEVEDFELVFRVKNTADTGGHRDCCVFFCYQDPANFYYVHLGASPDPHSGQIMLVDDAPRRALTDNQRKTGWDDEWHIVKLVRNSTTGKIAIYFDDMDQPHMEITDKTFGRGRIGLGSFDDLNQFDDVELRGK